MTLETANKKKRSRRNWRVSREANAPDKYLTKGFSRVEKMFYYYPKIKKAVEEIEGEKSYYQSGHRDGGGSSNHAFISDPTFQMASNNLSGIRQIVLDMDTFGEDTVKRPQDWMKVVEQTFEHFKDNSLVTDILRKRYFMNEPTPKTCIRYEITHNKYYRARDTGINYARDCAIQMGLIKIFDE